MRTCVDCGGDISHRGPTAYLCVACAKLRVRAHVRAAQARWWRKLGPAQKSRIKQSRNAWKRGAWRRHNPVKTRVCEADKCSAVFIVRAGWIRRFCPTHLHERRLMQQRQYARMRRGWANPAGRPPKWMGLAA